MLHRPGIAGVVIAAGLAAQAAAQQYTVTIITPPAGATWTNSSLRGATPGARAGVTGSSPFNLTRAAVWMGASNTFVDLHPAAGYFRTVATCASGGIQGGHGTIDQTGSIRTHALLWQGTAASVVDLHPQGMAGYDTSVMLGADGTVQVGSISGTAVVDEHAGRWQGTAASFVDLHPAAFRNSLATGIRGPMIVGYGQDQAFETHALVWTGGGGAVDLHRAPFTGTRAFATDGVRQGGEGEGVFDGRFETHALLWSGSPAGIVDLHPPGYDASIVLGMGAGVQVGHVAGPATGFDEQAALWQGTAASRVDLHALLPPGFSESRARAVGVDGVIVGEAFGGGVLRGVIWTPLPPPCYANCDGSTAAPILNVQDFTCFLQRYAAGEPYANCDQSTVAPVLNVQDFTCFLQRYAAGCP